MFSCEYWGIFKNNFFTEHLRETTFENKSKKNNETVTSNTDLRLFLRLLSLSREQDVDVKNALSRELYSMNFVLFHWIC